MTLTTFAERERSMVLMETKVPINTMNELNIVTTVVAHTCTATAVIMAALDKDADHKRRLR